jgi:hypothetical protein
MGKQSHIIIFRVVALDSRILGRCLPKAVWGVNLVPRVARAEIGAGSVNRLDSSGLIVRGYDLGLKV